MAEKRYQVLAATRAEVVDYRQQRGTGGARKPWREYVYGEEARMIEDMREFTRTEYPEVNFSVWQNPVSPDKYDTPVMILLNDPEFGMWNPFAIEVTLDGVLL